MMRLKITDSPTSRRVAFVVILLAVFLLGWVLRGGGPTDTAADGQDLAAADNEPTTWTCSMHPNIQLPEPGQCPICFMDLIPVVQQQGEDLGPSDLVMSEAAAALAEIRTEPVQRMFVTKQVRLVGKVAYDETRTRSITARVPGRLEKLYVDFTGRTVRRGEKLAAIYSPELYAAQAELKAALRGVQSTSGGDQSSRRSAEATLTSVRDRLRLWGLDDDQIAALEESDTVSDQLTIRAPLGGVVVRKDAVEGRYVKVGSPLYAIADLSQVWVTLAAYESDLIWLRQRQRVAFTAPALPGHEFAGEIVFIDQILDDRTRTVEVRIAVDNENGALKPGMLVHAAAEVTLDAAGDPMNERTVASAGDPDSVRGVEGAQPPLVVPASAPLWTGARSVVYVRLRGRAEPTFSGREVILGPRAGHYYLVVSGLVEGEQVVTNGNFKIDSALQIQARPSMMNPIGGGPAPQHQHGDLGGGGSGLSGGDSKPGAVGPTHHTDAVTADSGPLAAPTCFVERLGDILAAYMPLQTALAGDDDTAALAAADGVVAAVASVSCAEEHLPEGSQEVWREVYDHLVRAAAQVQRADAIAPRRLALQPLSDNLWTALTRFGHAADDTVRLFHCPMAMGGAGADWIQLDATTANPYYGSAMLRCGSQTELLAQPGSGDPHAGHAHGEG